ncbi:NlpC/P60 family protein [Streptomyces iconiensis]|uniref:NlpC/P60 family protein n=1 Tax=Streptomyces iconiensis TaxID=1384038 RepID=A0ABT7A2T8_9ACTN|nr:NlpC/P60 family protein [Streptomyces iconiensis]MDJ1135384.1 NlpC/P60 family protein [Streptomyces iconiensis]
MSVAAAGTAAVLAPTGPAGAAPADDKPSAATVNSRVDQLYEQAESATEKYNGAAERTGKLRRQVEHAQDSVARGQAEVNDMRDGLASLAGAQYREGGIDPALALMLTENPDSYLDKAATLDRVSSRQTLRLRQLQAAQRSLRQERAEAADKLDRLDSLQRSLKRQKKNVQKKLSAAQRLLNKLSPEERAERERAARGGDRSEGGSGDSRASSGRAAAAVAAVESAVGSPYAWGAAGPGTFDCSGLTQWAYGKAGTSIPRTSQGQRSAGRQVPLSEARPGDLVVYRDDASHVGMYTGNGQVVHAPYPGAQVRYDPVGMMPVSAVTRP